MFNENGLGWLRLLSLVGVISVVAGAACDGVDACTQFDRDFHRRLKQCGDEPVEYDDFPDGCTDLLARRSECFSDCLESNPSCAALFDNTPEGEALGECWVQCQIDNQ